jgi:Flp pilus assembly protein TadG
MIGVKARRHARGQSVAEFALVIPLFLVMLFGIIDIGRVIWANDALANAAREGARYASVTGSSLVTPTSTKADIKTYTRNYAIAAGTNVIVTVCYSAVANSSATAGCSGDTNSPATASNDRGSLVTVQVTSTVPILTGALLGMGAFTVSGTSTVLVNN